METETFAQKQWYLYQNLIEMSGNDILKNCRKSFKGYMRKQLHKSKRFCRNWCSKFGGGGWFFWGGGVWTRYTPSPPPSPLLPRWSWLKTPSPLPPPSKVKLVEDPPPPFPSPQVKLVEDPPPLPPFPPRWSCLKTPPHRQVSNGQWAIDIRIAFLYVISTVYPMRHFHHGNSRVASQVRLWKKYYPSGWG